MTVAVAVEAAASRAPVDASAVAATVILIVAPLGSAADGVRTRTLSFSAQAIFPVIGFPFADALNAAAVAARSIGWVKRTDRRAPTATSVVPLRGRKRTTFGPRAVRTESATGGEVAAPSASAMERARLTRYVAPAVSGLIGVKTMLSAVGVPSAGWKVPATVGSMVKAASAAATSTARSKRSSNPVDTSASWPLTTVARIDPVVAGRVTNVVRSGPPSGWPWRSAAIAPTVIV